MIIVRFSIKDKKGKSLLDQLSDAWDQFYSTALPEIMAIFIPLAESVNEIRQLTLLGFRDSVLLKTKIEEVLENGQSISPHLKQMLLMLASVHESKPPSENYMRLETLIVKVIRPYLGVKGYYPSFDDEKVKADLNARSSARMSPRKTKEVSKIQPSIDETNNNKEISSLTREIGNVFIIPSDSSSASSDMSEYIAERNQRWQKREEMLVSESVL